MSAPKIVPMPPFSLRAADDDRGDDGKEVGLAERVARAVQPAGIEQAGEAGTEPGEHHHRRSGRGRP